MVQYRRTLILFFFFSSNWVINGQADSIFQLSPEARFKAIYIFFGNKLALDSSTYFRLIRDFQKRALDEHDEKSLLLLDHKRLTYLLEFKMQMDSWAAEAGALTEKARKKKYTALEAYCLNSIGYYYYLKEEYGQAFVYYLQAYDLYKNFSPDDFVDKNYHQYSLAKAYYRFGDYRNALHYGLEASRDTTATPWLQLFNHNLVAMTYLREEQYDSARIYFQNNLKYARHVGRTDWVGIETGNLGNTWYLQQAYDQAIPLLDSGSMITHRYKLYDNSTGFFTHLADSYIMKGMTEPAWKYLQQAKIDLEQQYSYQGKYEYYKTLSAYNRLTGNSASALLALDSAFVFKDSIDRAIDQNQKTNAEIQVQNERQQKIEASLQNEKKLRNLIIGGLLSILLLIGVSIWFWNKRQKYEQLMLKEKARLAEVESKTANEELQRYTEYLLEKNDLIFQLSQRIEQEVGKHDEELLNKTILTESEWSNFRKLFTKSYPAFFNQLNHLADDITPAEERMAALIKLKLKNKAIADMLGIGADGVRKGKQRLRQRLNLTTESDLDEYIQVLS